MTVDIRAAAEAEAKAIRFRYKGHDYAANRHYKSGFSDGAVWAQARLTPTREQIAKAIFMTDYEHMGPEAWEAARLDGNNDRQDAFMKADAVLALLAEGCSDAD